MNSQFNIERFKKTEKIGEGSFYSVYKVVDKETSQVYTAMIFKDNEPQENTFRQYDIISKLSHPSIIKYIGYSPVNFSKNSRPTIIFEYYSKGSLREMLLLDRNRSSPPIYDNTKKLIIIYGIASGMSYLHSNNIIHMDLNPSNILLNDDLFPIISGFHLMSFPAENIGQNIKGTPLYIAPEVFKECDYTTKVDVYAFSMILYEIVTGNELFQSQSMYLVLRSVISGIRPTIPDSMSKNCENLIRKCWCGDPDQRPTFDEIANIVKNDPKAFINGDFDQEFFENYVNSLK